MLVSAYFMSLSIAICVPLVLVIARHRVVALKALTALLSAASLSAVGFVSTASAASAPIPQAALTISNTTVTAVAFTSISLTTTGGSGTGAVTFKVVGSSCIITGSAGAYAVKKTTVGTCDVTATKAASTGYQSASSKAVTFTFTAQQQATLSVSNTALTSLANKSVTLATKGGSGTGAVSFSVTGDGCSVTAASHSFLSSEREL